MLGTRSRGVAALLLAMGTVGMAVVGACATNKGALMLAINTDMKAPKDVNAVSVTISTNGAIKHSFIGRVTPQGEVLLPATLAIVEPDDKSASIRIRVMAFQDAKARVMRDVRTTVPSGGRTALLRIALNFASDASAVGEPLPNGLVPDPLPGTGGTSSGTSSGGGFSGGAAAFDFFGAFQPPCPDIENQTIIDGECKDNYVDSAALPDFDQHDLGNSTDPGSCFDVAKCFAGALGVGDSSGDASLDAGVVKDATAAPTDAGADTPDAAPAKFKDFRPAAVTLDRTTCALQLNGANPARLNLALVTPDTGECVSPGECYIPIDRGPSGWDDQNGSVQLPKFVCTLLSKKNLRLAVSPETCAAKEESNPICVQAGATGTGGTSSGTSGTSGSNGTSGTGSSSGASGTSGTSGGFNACAGAMPDTTKPTGTFSNGSGTVQWQGGTVDLSTVVDGYATTGGPPASHISLSLTGYKGACGYFANDVHKIGAGVVQIQVGSPFPLSTQTYPPSQMSVGAGGAPPGQQPGTECASGASGGGGPSPTGTGITITAIDAQHVAGSFDYNPGTGALVGTFDLPFCQQNPAAPTSCCVP